MTNKTEPNFARDKLRQLVDIAITDSMYRGGTHHPHARYGKPGELYLSCMGPVSRHIMESLKSEDNYDDRWPPYDNTDSSNRKK
jgi:hypothetical protein